MKRKILLVLISVIAVFACAFGLSACNNPNGTYYKLKANGEPDPKTYFILKSGKWEDEDGESGTYKKDGENITFYVTFFGETEEIQGTLNDYVLKINDDTYISEKHKHRYSNWETIKEATCAADGIKTRSCECGILEREVIDKLPHNFDDWQITKNATCTEEGVNTRICSVCKTIETEAIEKVPHNVSRWQFNYENHWKFCYICNQKFEQNSHNGKNNCMVCAFPLVDTTGLQFSLNKSGNGYIVSGIGSAIGNIIRIPASYEGLPVTSIGDSAFANCKSLEKITIPDSVTSIDGNAFRYCTSLSSINIPGSVTYIGYAAFYNCKSLTSITIPDSVTSIGMEAFDYCYALTRVKFEDINGWRKYYTGHDSGEIDTEILSDPAAAAKYLLDASHYYYFVKKD